ncbi:MAG TPA: hypothetical protein VJ852_13100 [Gemmatimonadaceae bacterium]|nr:hypothetical protein [Gemmatimonadaceae bacterium]
MIDSHLNRHDGSLPVELELALRSATWRAMVALHSLRTAVRDHVYQESARGCSQVEIDDGLRMMIDTCTPAPGEADHSAERAGEVTRQVLVWSATFYGGKAEAGTVP